MRGNVISVLLILCLLPGRPVLAEHNGGGGDDNPIFRELTPAELNAVSVVDVAKCWAIVSATVVTAGRAARALQYLGRLGRFVHKADDAVAHKLGDWILKAGIEGLDAKMAEGLGVILVKAAELVGISTAGVLLKKTMLKIIQAAQSLVSSCSKVVQVYYDGILSAGQLLFGSSKVCDGKLDKYVSCQRVCGASVSETEKYRILSSRIDRECDWEPMKKNMILLIAGGMRQMCYQHFCAGQETYYTDRGVTKLSQCGPYYTDPKDRAIIQNMKEHCENGKRAQQFLNK